MAGQQSTMIGRLGLLLLPEERQHAEALVRRALESGAISEIDAELLLRHVDELSRAKTEKRSA